MSIDRSAIREALLEYFQTESFVFEPNRDQDKGSINMMSSYIIKALSLPSYYQEGEGRAYVRKLVTQEIRVLREYRLCKRISWGRYRPLN